MRFYQSLSSSPCGGSCFLLPQRLAGALLGLVYKYFPTGSGSLQIRCLINYLLEKE